jgi:GT2 family glycosyltransferase
VRAAAVYVHYHAAEPLRLSCGALLADGRRAGIELEIVVVDNGSAPDEAVSLAALPARRIEVGHNAGFAGGVNRGMAATSAPVVLLVNPDARVRDGALPRLLATLETCDVVGPRLFWGGSQALLPPAEERSRSAELLRVLGRCSPLWARRARRRWRRQARRHWEATAPLPSFDLSGGFLALRRETWSRVGAFDERYRLYFEETDWLRRARAAGAAACHEPRAEVEHDVGASSARQGRAGEWFEQSAAQFRRRWYGPRFARAIEGIAAAGGEPRLEPLAALPRQGLPGGEEDGWIEMSPNPAGWPAAGERLRAGESWSPPPPLRAAASSQPWFVRRCDAAGRELGAWSIDLRSERAG